MVPNPTWRDGSSSSGMDTARTISIATTKAATCLPDIQTRHYTRGASEGQVHRRMEWPLVTWITTRGPDRVTIHDGKVVITQLFTVIGCLDAPLAAFGLGTCERAKKY